MFCKNCGKEIDDNSNFCQFCGAVNSSSKKVDIRQEINKFIENFKLRKNIAIPMFGTIIVLLILYILCVIYVKSPEYVIYNSIIAIKNNNYDRVTKYINIDKVANNIVDKNIKNSMDESELEDNPFSGFAYMLVEAMKPQMVAITKDIFKEVIESQDNILKEISKPKILLFICIKKYNGLSLQKTVNETDKVEFKFSNGKQNNDLYILLNKTPESHWEIVDIYGYNLFDENNVQYIQHGKQILSTNNNKDKKITKDVLLNNAKIHYSKFKEKQKEYSLNFWRMNKEEKDIAFKKLYADYLDKISNFEIYFTNYEGYETSDEYIKNYKKEFAKFGINFVYVEGYNIIPDYQSLIKTLGIPKPWKDWLKLQENYVLQRLYICNNSACEGETLSVDELEQGIIDLENTEKLSKEIAAIKREDYNYIPDTSKEFLYTYLVGNELYSHFDEGVANKIYTSSKKSYEHFIENHKDSRYYPLVVKYYDKIKANSFKYSSKTQDWLIKEIEKI